MLSNRTHDFLNKCVNFVQSAWLQPCALCGALSPQAVCAPCVADLPCLPLPVCPQCALPTAIPSPCLTCHATPPPFDHLLAAYPFAWPLSGLLHAFKYGQQQTLAGALAELALPAMAARLALTPAAHRPDCLIPLPQSEARWRERGFWPTQEWGRKVAASLAIPLNTTALLRSRDTPQQAGLDREARLVNVQGSFFAPKSLKGLSAVLIDDVTTTGATLSEAAQTLRQAGVARVECWVLMRALPSI